MTFRRCFGLTACPRPSFRKTKKMANTRCIPLSEHASLLYTGDAPQRRKLTRATIEVQYPFLTIFFLDDGGVNFNLNPFRAPTPPILTSPKIVKIMGFPVVKAFYL